MDKTSIGLLADVLYIKGIICYEEFEDIMNAITPQDLDKVVEGMLTDKYNVYRKGEAYIGYKKL
jgi:hypothetical protein